MEHSNVSENEITYIDINVKLEPFDQEYDYTQNADPLESDNNVHMEIPANGSDQATEEYVLKYEQDNNDIKIGELDIKTECFGNKALDTILDTCSIIQDDTSVHCRLAGNSSKHTKHGSVETQEQADKTNTTRYVLLLSNSCEPQHSDVISENSTNDGSLLNVTSAANHTRARSDTCSSGVGVLRIHKHSTSEEEGSKQSSLIVHSQRHPSFVCDVCDMTFKNSRNLVSHKVVHTSQKPHVCDVCKKTLSRSSALTLHKRIHTGQKPYVCDVCKKKFSCAGNLATHKRIHTGQKPYVCDICKKKFSQAGNLATHVLIHTGQESHICDICNKKFSRAGNLATHKLIHTGQKPHVCHICNKKFSLACNLARHKLIHAGVKLYVCDICKKEFRQLSNLTKHKLVHTVTSGAPC